MGNALDTVLCPFICKPDPQTRTGALHRGESRGKPRALPSSPSIPTRRFYRWQDRGLRKGLTCPRSPHQLEGGRGQPLGLCRSPSLPLEGFSTVTWNEVWLLSSVWLREDNVPPPPPGSCTNKAEASVPGAGNRLVVVHPLGTAEGSRVRRKATKRSHIYGPCSCSHKS